MTANRVVYLNGLYTDLDRATVSVLDRGFCYGDGLFETMRAYGGMVFRLQAHLDRLRGSLEMIFLDLPLTDDELREAICGTLERNGCRDAIVRLTVSRGLQDFGFDIDSEGTPTVVVVSRPARLQTFEEEPQGIRIALFPDCAVRTSGLPVQIKSCNFLSYILVRERARQQGVDEAILMDGNRSVTEGATSNLFLVKDGRLRTPALDAFILPGVTREVVLELARECGIPCDEAEVTAEEVHAADEVFLTNSGFEILPVREADGQNIGTGMIGPVTQRLQDKFRQRVHQGE